MTLPEEHMRRAIELAKKGIYTTSPNPMVGCVITKDDKIIGEGWHVKVGHNHAEVNAIKNVRELHGKKAEELLKHSKVYVTLEPCSTTGRTPPCSDALIEAGVKKVYIAQEDTSQEGLEALRKANIEVEVGLLNDKAINLNTGFFTRINQGRPYVTCKIACSLDGGIALSNGESKWITSEASRRDAHILRSNSDAILTGIGTVLADDPSLTARINDDEFLKLDQQPLRCVVDSKLQVTGNKKIVSDGLKTIIFINSAESDLKYDNVEVIKKSGENGRVSLTETLKHLGNIGINNLMLEAGPKLVDGMLEERLIDKFIIYIAPKLLGANKLNFAKLGGSLKNLGTIELELQKQEVVGEDLKLSILPKY
jgi:diaminohydroxyphosphoribosylaminopyrimidine deaminase/5-amino-6-(5-phosphoribosylamino)uracil reductase